jgi:4-carboxymuconolactone decarboxylase
VARLRYVGGSSAPAVEALFWEIERMGRPVLNLYRVLANQPPALAAFLGMSRYVRSASSLDPGLRELTILATAHELGQNYEIRHHTDVAKKIGLSLAQLAAVAPGAKLEALTPAERCAVEFARQVARKRTCDDQTFKRLETFFSPDEIVDLVVTTAWYHLCAVILGSLQVDLEANLP